MRKTSTTLAAFCVLQEQKLVDSMMVVAPLRVTQLVWPLEVQKWLDFNHLDVAVLRGSKRDELLDPRRKRSDVYVVNWESLEWLARTAAATGFKLPDMWVLDESTMVKNHASNRFSALTSRTQRKKSKNVVWPYPALLRDAKRVVELTGTPSPNNYIDLWAQMFLLDGGKALGERISHFRSLWCWQNPHAPNHYEFRKEFANQLIELVAPLVCRISKEQWSEIPEPIVNDITIELPPAARKAYEQMRHEYVVELAVAKKKKAARAAIAGNAAGVLTKLRQIASGGIYYEASAEWSEFVTVRESEWLHDAKLDALEDLVEELSGKPLLLFYGYKMEAEKIRSRFKGVPNLSGVSGKEALRLIHKWNDNKIPILMAHPKSAGHGLNLQEGGAFHSAWFTLPYDLELYDQANARLARGEQQEQVMIHRFISEGTVDQVVASVLAQKHRDQDALLDAVGEAHGDS